MPTLKPLKHTAIITTESQHARIRRLATAEGKSISAFLRPVVLAFIEQREADLSRANRRAKAAS